MSRKRYPPGPAPADSPREKRGSPQGPGTILPAGTGCREGGPGRLACFLPVFSGIPRTAPEDRGQAAEPGVGGDP